jgi:hypothetical protein
MGFSEIKRFCFSERNATLLKRLDLALLDFKYT